jgi:hypothetical protein
MIAGGYPYTDPKTGMKFDGFDAGGFGDQVLRVRAHRVANPKIYLPGDVALTVEYIANQIDEYQCLRHGNNPRYCLDENQPALPASVASDRACSCGEKLNPVYCPTCSGQKITHYICPKCGRTQQR